ncbi:hypothetical protein D3C86_1454190 [compost metagenome]
MGAVQSYRAFIIAKEGIALVDQSAGSRIFTDLYRSVDGIMQRRIRSAILYYPMGRVVQVKIGHNKMSGIIMAIMPVVFRTGRCRKGNR